MSNLIEHAKNEFLACGYIPLDQPQEDGPNKWMQEGTLKLLEVFSEQQHSGMSASFAISIFKTLASFEPLGPLTGEPWEWVEVVDGEMWQNRRCGHVFKDTIDGIAYDAEGKIFREPNGCCYTNRDSRVPITFPYIPKREYVDVPEEK